MVLAKARANIKEAGLEDKIGLQRDDIFPLILKIILLITPCVGVF